MNPNQEDLQQIIKAYKEVTTRVTSKSVPESLRELGVLDGAIHSLIDKTKLDEKINKQSKNSK